jgi:uncharacterized protein YgbK (DUF1537 family)
MFTEITDDLTGAADSSSYFTGRGQKVHICISGDYDLSRQSNELLSINLSSRNVKPEIAEEAHYKLLKKLPDTDNQIFMKKIGTGFRGNDAYELNGILRAVKDSLIFMIDNAPDLGTFTLYGNQFCEGEILPKSLYAKDPIMPPKEAYIPNILGHASKFKIGLVDIDVIKGGDILKTTTQQVEAGCRIIVFDAITKNDTEKIIMDLMPHFKKIFWTGSLGIANGLGEHLYGPWEQTMFKKRSMRCLGFCASAYDVSKKQQIYSQKRGLQLVKIDIDKYIDGDTGNIQQSATEAIELNKSSNIMLVPKVDKYSYKPKTSKKILECFSKVAPLICSECQFGRIIVIGGETAQTIFAATGTKHLDLGRPLEPGVAQGIICDGLMSGKEFSLKGGSMGTDCTLEKMMGRLEVEY